MNENLSSHTLDAIKSGVDYGVAPTVVAASMLQYLPEVAALFGLIWYAIRIWETCTVRGWFGRDCQEEKSDG